MTENLFENNFLIKINHSFLDFFQKLRLNIKNPNPNSDLHDKFSYIAAFNPFYYQDPHLIHKKNHIPYFSEKYYLKNLFFTLFGYYGVTFISTLLFSKMKTFQGKMIYQNNLFKKTWLLPIIGFSLFHHFYFSLERFENEFGKEIEEIKNNKDDMEWHFAQKKKIQKLLSNQKQDILDQNKNKATIEEALAMQKIEKIENPTAVLKKNSESIEKIKSAPSKKPAIEILCKPIEYHFILKFVSEIERKNIL